MSEEYQIRTKKYKKPTAFRFPKAIRDSWWLSTDYENDEELIEINGPNPEDVEEYDDYD